MHSSGISLLGEGILVGYHRDSDSIITDADGSLLGVIGESDSVVPVYFLGCGTTHLLHDCGGQHERSWEPDESINDKADQYLGNSSWLVAGATLTAAAPHLEPQCTTRTATPGSVLCSPSSGGSLLRLTVTQGQQPTANGTLLLASSQGTTASEIPFR